MSCADGGASLMSLEVPATALEVLQTTRYFATVPPEELRRLAARCGRRSLRAGETLFDEGEPCRALFIVTEGG